MWCCWDFCRRRCGATQLPNQDNVDMQRQADETRDSALRCSHMAVRIGNNLVVLGGTSRVGPPSLQDIAVLNMKTLEWTTHQTPLDEDHDVPYSRVEACGVALGTDIYMHGGVSLELGSLGDLWKLSCGDGQYEWSKVQLEHRIQCPEPRQRHSGFAYDNAVWIFGGAESHDDDEIEDNSFTDYPFRSGTANNELYRFAPEDRLWDQPYCDGTIPHPRQGHASTVYHHKMLVHGGMVVNRDNLSDFFELDLETMAWTELHPANAPPAGRVFHTITALSDGNVLMIGGHIIDNQGETFRSCETWMFNLRTMNWTLKQRIDDYKLTRHTTTLKSNSQFLIVGGLRAYSAEDFIVFADLSVLKLKRCNRISLEEVKV